MATTWLLTIIAEFNTHQRLFQLVSGSPAQRLEQAVAMIDHLQKS